mgnify:CR=1 FL=1
MLSTARRHRTQLPRDQLVPSRIDRDRSSAERVRNGLPVECYADRAGRLALVDDEREAKGERRGLVDQVAAAVMLQSWLDAQPGNQ